MLWNLTSMWEKQQSRVVGMMATNLCCPYNLALAHVNTTPDRFFISLFWTCIHTGPVYTSVFVKCDLKINEIHYVRSR